VQPSLTDGADVGAYAGDAILSPDTGLTNRKVGCALPAINGVVFTDSVLPIPDDEFPSHH